MFLTGASMQRIQKQILSLLVSGSHSVWRVIDYQDASLPEFFEIIEKMEKDGIIEIKDNYKIGDLFKIMRGKNSKNPKTKGNIPFISSTSTNNGIHSFIEYDEIKIIDGNTITVANNGSVGETFYQKNIETKFFHHFLKENGDNNSGLPEAYVFDTGNLGWHKYPVWPPKNTVKKTYYSNFRCKKYSRLC